MTTRPTLAARSAPKRDELLGIAALAVLGAVVLSPYRRVAGDDACISLRFAENLATGQGYSWNPGEPAYGASSPLWVLLLAGARRLGAPVMIAAHGLDAAFALLAIAVFFQVCCRTLRRPEMRWCAVLLFSLDPWFVRFSMSGTEHSLALFLLSASLLAHLSAEGAPRASWAAPILAGLGVLTRPELTLFAALLILGTFLFGGEARVEKALTYALFVALIVAPWLLYAMTHFWTIVPGAVFASAGDGDGDGEGEAGSRPETLMYLGGFYLFLAIGAALCLWLSHRRIGAAIRDPEVRARWFLPVSWALASPLLHASGSAVGAGRHLLLGLPAMLLVGVKAWELTLLHGSRLRRPAIVVGALCGLSLCLSAFLQRRYCWVVTERPEGVDPARLSLARWIGANTRPGDVISADRIGVVGFFSKRAVVDRAGLVSPEMRALQEAHDPRVMWREIRRRGPGWLIAEEDKAALERLDPGYGSLELVAVYDVEREDGGDSTAKRRVNLYRTHWAHAR